MLIPQANLQTSLLNDWRTRSGDFFREKYDYENARIKKLQNSNKLLQKHVSTASDNFERYIRRKDLQSR
jgi:hypothetical protein